MTPDTSLRPTRIDVMKKPSREERQRMCTGKRRYRTQGDALDAAALVGFARDRTAYLCPLCGQWHLASKPRHFHG